MKLARIEYQGEICEAMVTCSGHRGTTRRPGLPQTRLRLRPGATVVRGRDQAAAAGGPRQDLAVGWNFREHIREMGRAVAGGSTRSGEEVPAALSSSSRPPVSSGIGTPSSTPSTRPGWSTRASWPWSSAGASAG